MSENLSNLAQTTLQTTVVAGDLTWIVNDPASGPSFPSPNFRVRVGTSALTGELLLVTAVLPNTPVAGRQTWTVERAKESTTAQGWAALTQIQHVLTKAGLDDRVRTIWTDVQTSISYAAVAGDFVEGDTSGGPITVTLPDATLCPGKCVGVAKSTADANAVTVATSLSQTINGDLTQVLDDIEDCLTVKSNGVGWRIF